jgi:hypothetical protein
VKLEVSGGAQGRQLNSGPVADLVDQWQSLRHRSTAEVGGVGGSRDDEIFNGGTTETSSCNSAPKCSPLLGMEERELWGRSKNSSPHLDVKKHRRPRQNARS